MDKLDNSNQNEASNLDDGIQNNLDTYVTHIIEHMRTTICVLLPPAES